MLTMIDQAVRDIVEWMEENHFEATAQSLRPGASDGVLAGVESRLGAPLPLELRRLYELHDGQSTEANPFFEHLAFLTLEQALQHRSYPGMLYAYFGVREDGRIERSGIYCDAATPLQEDEYSARWFPFANTEGDYLALNLDTGRVFRVVKDLPALRLAAPDLATFLGDYASAIWDERFEVAGDTNLAGVEVEGMLYLQRYLQR